MIEVSTELAAYFDSTTQGVSCGLVTISLRDPVTLAYSTVYRWAARKTALSFGGTTWLPHGQGGRPIVEWGDIECVAGLDVTAVNLTLHCGDGITIATPAGAKPLPVAATKGLFHKGRVLIQRAYMPTHSAPVVGIMSEFEGTIQSAPATTDSVTLVVESDLALFNQPYPKFQLSATCLNTLYDGACGLDAAAFTDTVSVLAGSSRTVVKTTDANAADYWTIGHAVFRSGANGGQRRSIKASAGGELTVFPPLPVAPQAGDQVDLVRGCAYTRDYCKREFDNLRRFRGTPALPAEEKR